MNFQKIVVPVAGAAMVVWAYQAMGWPGVALVAGGLVFWLLLHFTRTMQVLKRAADRPMGYCDSAVMLNARLKPRMTLLHVVAMTRALGEQRSAEGEQPEQFRWTDAGQSWVDAEFAQGKLVKWTLVRPPADDAPATVEPDAAPR